jgi:uncharacterized protein YggE
MKRTITVPGTGRVTVEPDVASVRLGVNIQRESAGQAREDAANTMNAIIEAITGQGVERRDVRTAMVTLGPVTDYSEGGPRIVGYQLLNSVEVTLRNLDVAGALIDATLGAGASTLDSLEFRLEDPSAAEETARTLAIENAHSRATTLATAAGSKLGKVVSVTESEHVGGGGPIPYARAMAMEAKADTPVEAGTQEIAVAVTVTFALA